MNLIAYLIKAFLELPEHTELLWNKQSFWLEGSWTHLHISQEIKDRVKYIYYGCRGTIFQFKRVNCLNYLSPGFRNWGFTKLDVLKVITTVINSLLAAFCHRISLNLLRKENIYYKKRNTKSNCSYLSHWPIIGTTSLTRYNLKPLFLSLEWNRDKGHNFLYILAQIHVGRNLNIWTVICDITWKSRVWKSFSVLLPSTIP